MQSRLKIFCIVKLHHLIHRQFPLSIILDQLRDELAGETVPFDATPEFDTSEEMLHDVEGEAVVGICGATDLHEGAAGVGGVVRGFKDEGEAGCYDNCQRAREGWE